jgi:hypothetical protein
MEEQEQREEPQEREAAVLSAREAMSLITSGMEQPSSDDRPNDELNG